MRDGFAGYHPAVNALFFTLVLAGAMVLDHPLCLAISLCGGAASHLSMMGRQKTGKALWYVLPMMALAAAVNPAFSHAGATILTYLPSGNPLTLESLAYGLGAGAMLGSVMVWFACCTHVMTADKLIYLFGRTAPALSLVFSMTLRFVPRFSRQLSLTVQVQRGLNGGEEPDGLWQRLRLGVRALSIVITWSLENGVETADSMRARGYGLPGRTAFSIYRLTERDRRALAWLMSWGGYVLCGALAGGLGWRYYPTLRGTAVTPLTASFFGAYLALCFTPVILDWEEGRRWRRSASKI